MLMGSDKRPEKVDLARETGSDLFARAPGRSSKLSDQEDGVGKMDKDDLRVDAHILAAKRYAGH